LRAAAAALWLLLSAMAAAAEPRPGHEAAESAKPWRILIEDLRAAVVAEGMVVVTEAGPTEAAAARGVIIPGNRVLGVFRNDFAVRLVRLSETASIEAPIRFHVTEQPGGGARLAWQTPSHLLAPYLDEGGSELAALAAELDSVFARIAARALR
jgi:uncharacterized protein (DUF302 family)